MSRELIVNNIPFDYPDQGDEPGWGSDATGWAEEVTNVLNNLLGPADILETSFSVANNQNTVADVTGLVFNTGTVRSAVINYAVYRLSDSNPSGNTESGIINLVYDNNNGWLMSQGDVLGLSGVYFTVTPSGQIQYTSTDIGSVNYVGAMKFRAKSLIQ